MILFESIAGLLDITEPLILSAFLVFARVSAMVSVLPAFGQQSIPLRIKLAVAIAFTVLVWPMIEVKIEVLPAQTFQVLPLIRDRQYIGYGGARVGVVSGAPYQSGWRGCFVLRDLTGRSNSKSLGSGRMGCGCRS